MKHDDRRELLWLAKNDNMPNGLTELLDSLIEQTHANTNAITELAQQMTRLIKQVGILIWLLAIMCIITLITAVSLYLHTS